MDENVNQSTPQWDSILDVLNKAVMRVNEFEMGKVETKVDFENMGDFPGRLSGLFTALGEGIAKAGVKLLTASFLILPYTKSTVLGGDVEVVPGDEYTRQDDTSPLLYRWDPAATPSVRAKSLPDDEELALKAAIDEAQASVDAGALEEGVVQIVQVTYFVKPSTATSLDEFDLDAVIIRERRDVPQDRDPDVSWILGHPKDQYIQRFVFTFSNFARDRSMINSVFSKVGIDRLNHALGAFFSWVGITGDSVMRLQIDRLLGFQLLKAHQLGNELVSLYRFKFESEKIMDGFTSCPSADVAVIEKLDEVLWRWRNRLRDMKDLIAAFTKSADYMALERERNGFEWFQVLLVQLKDLGPDSEFDLSGIAENTKDLQINITRYLMEQLVQSLYKNAKRVWEYDIANGLRENTGRQRFRVAAVKDNGDLKLTFANEGREIAGPLQKKLFRQPVPREAQKFNGSGNGLFALGLALRTVGVFYPVIQNIPDFGPSFTFLLPVVSS